MAGEDDLGGGYCSDDEGSISERLAQGDTDNQVSSYTLILVVLSLLQETPKSILAYFL